MPRSVGAFAGTASRRPRLHTPVHHVSNRETTLILRLMTASSLDRQPGIGCASREGRSEQPLKDAHGHFHHSPPPAVGLRTPENATTRMGSVVWTSLPAHSDPGSTSAVDDSKSKGRRPDNPGASVSAILGIPKSLTGSP